MVYVSQHQINIQIPYEASIGPNKAIVVSNGASPSANGTITIAATSPGIFTSDGTNVAAINTSQDDRHHVDQFSLRMPRHIGDSVSLYVTGEGTYTTAVTPLDGYIIPAATAPAAMPALNAAVTATIDGVNAPGHLRRAIRRRYARRAGSDAHGALAYYEHQRSSGGGHDWRKRPRRPAP